MPNMEFAASASGSVRENMSKASGNVRTGLGIPTANTDNKSNAQSESGSIVDGVSEYCPKLTFHQRIMGFGLQLICGYLMTFMSFRLFIKLVNGNPATLPLVFLYSSGNILSLMSSMFLSGPKQQLKSMFGEKRQITSITYLVTLVCSMWFVLFPYPTGPKISLIGLLLLVQMSVHIVVYSIWACCRIMGVLLPRGCYDLWFRWMSSHLFLFGNASLWTLLLLFLLSEKDVAMP